MKDMQKQTRRLRLYRKIHRWLGGVLFSAFFLVAISGLALGWKKHSGGLILPETHEGVSANLETWLPLDSLHTIALQVFRDSISQELSTALDRIDVRPDKGMLKFVFIDEYWGLQLDGTTGRLLHIERRRSDFIENLHDGSIIDHIFKTDGRFKLGYTTVMGVALLLFSVTGFWLYYGPKRLMKKKRLMSS